MNWVAEILTFEQAGVSDVLSGSALQLLAGKVAAVSGDVRRALDIARRVIELAESKSVLSPATDTTGKLLLRRLIVTYADKNKSYQVKQR